MARGPTHGLGSASELQPLLAGRLLRPPPSVGAAGKLKGCQVSAQRIFSDCHAGCDGKRHPRAFALKRQGTVFPCALPRIERG